MFQHATVCLHDWDLTKKLSWSNFLQALHGGFRVSNTSTPAYSKEAHTWQKDIERSKVKHTHKTKNVALAREFERSYGCRDGQTNDEAPALARRVGGRQRAERACIFGAATRNSDADRIGTKIHRNHCRGDAVKVRAAPIVRA